MKFIKPKSSKTKVGWNISEKTLTILSYYAKYTQYQEEDIVDMFLENLLLDKGFAEWINTRRYKKKIEAILNECKLVNTMEGEHSDGKLKETNRAEE